MAEAVDELFQSALTTEGPGAFDSYLDSICRLRHLSAFNAMLVRAQRPGVSWVATKKQWQRRGRAVLPGAIPIVILQPFGPVLFMYEATDTAGPPLSIEVNSTLLAEGDFSDRQWRAACRRAESFGVKVQPTAFGAHLAGTAQGIREYPVAVQQGESRWLVRTNSNFDLPTQMATLAHELGHIYCGHCGADPEGRWPERRPDSYEVRELEAEAVAWLVCNRLDLRTRSREYLSRLATPEAINAVSKGMGMYSIVRAVEYIESGPRVAMSA